MGTIHCLSQKFPMLHGLDKLAVAYYLKCVLVPLPRVYFSLRRHIAVHLQQGSVPWDKGPLGLGT